MSQGIIEGCDGRIGEAVEGRIGEAVEGRIGVEIGSESDERVGVGIDESLDEGLEEMWGREGETVMGGKDKAGTSDNTSLAWPARFLPFPFRRHRQKTVWGLSLEKLSLAS